MKYFNNKYFPREEWDYIASTLQNFHRNCDTVGRVGKLVGTAYEKKMGGASFVVYSYDYRYNCEKVRYVLRYVFEEDTFLLSNLKILPIRGNLLP